MGVTDPSAKGDVGAERSLAVDLEHFWLSTATQFVSRGGEGNDALPLIGGDPIQEGSPAVVETDGS